MMIDVLNYNGKWVIVQYVGLVMGDEDDNIVTFETEQEAEDYIEQGLTTSMQERSVPLVEEEPPLPGFYL